MKPSKHSIQNFGIMQMDAMHCTALSKIDTLPDKYWSKDISCFHPIVLALRRVNIFNWKEAYKIENYCGKLFLEDLKANFEISKQTEIMKIL